MDSFPLSEKAAQALSRFDASTKPRYFFWLTERDADPRATPVEIVDFAEGDAALGQVRESRGDAFTIGPVTLLMPGDHAVQVGSLLNNSRREAVATHEEPVLSIRALLRGVGALTGQVHITRFERRQGGAYRRLWCVFVQRRALGGPSIEGMLRYEDPSLPGVDTSRQ